MKFIFYLCICSASLQASMLPMPTLFTESEWKDVFSKQRHSEDYVVMGNGANVSGEVERLPTMTFPFVTLEFNPHDVAAMSISQQGGKYKLQYITREGHNYVGMLGQGKLVMTDREIDPKTISFVLFKERESAISKPAAKVSSLTLRNGDQLPFLFLPTPLSLTDGQKDVQLDPAKIVELHVNKGIYGYVAEQGDPVELPFHYVVDATLKVQLPDSMKLVSIPWGQIDYIQAYNGGFKKDFDGWASRLLMPPDRIEEAWESGVRSHACDEIGVRRGSLLVGALASIYTFQHEEEAPAYVLVAPAPEEDISDYLSVAEEELFEHLKREEVEPPTFDVPVVPVVEEPKKEESLPKAPEIPEMTSEELALLAELLGHAPMHPKDEDMAYVKETILSYDGLYAPAFYVGRSPVTNGEYELFVLTTECPCPVHWQNGRVPKGQRDLPVVNVSYEDAQRYAKWMGKRLPTESEWTRAVHAGVIKPKIKEWTSTSDKPANRVIMSRQGSESVNERLLDHQVGFRLVE